MPDITYAVVPTSTLPYDQAQAIKNLLTNMVTYSHGTSLPAGYAPLPDALYTAALSDISNDITLGSGSDRPDHHDDHHPPAVPRPPPPVRTRTTRTTRTHPTTPPLRTPPRWTRAANPTQLPLTSSDSSGGSGNSDKTPVAAPPSSIPTGFLLVGLSATTRFLLPAIVLLALGSLVGGLLLLFGPGAAARRRRNDDGGLP